MKNFFLLGLFLLSSFFLNAQTTNNPDNADSTARTVETISKSIFNSAGRQFSNQGKFYVHWGYNVSWYGKSDINFNGAGYNFTLKNVTAKDQPSKFGKRYLNLREISVPQFNFHAGYFIKDNYSISIGWDHMKYVVEVPQSVALSGYINPQISSPEIATGTYAGAYDNSNFTIEREFLTFEHTDGFNYVSAEIERYDDIWNAKSTNIRLTMETGLGLAAIIPRSDVRLFGVGENNYWNVAGYGLSAKAGLKFYFSKWFYLQSDIKTGWTNLSHIHTTGRNDMDKASQNIVFLENYWLFGFQF